MAGQADPQQVAVDAFQLQQESPDITRSLGDFDFCGYFNGLTVTRTVYAPSYAAYAFRQERHLVVCEDCVS